MLLFVIALGGFLGWFFHEFFSGEAEKHRVIEMPYDYNPWSTQTLYAPPEGWAVEEIVRSEDMGPTLIILRRK